MYVFFFVCSIQVYKHCNYNLHTVLKSIITKDCFLIIADVYYSSVIK